ncbi:tetratricopeptide repeat protein, partial [Brachyspira catarrhinii]
NYNKAIELLINKIDEYRNISKLDAYKKIDFHYISYLSNLALLFEKVSRDDECIPIYEELIKIYEDKIADDGEHVFYLKTVAEFYMKLNQKDNALKMYEKILEIDADNDETDEAKEKIRSIKLEK